MRTGSLKVVLTLALLLSGTVLTVAVGTPSGSTVSETAGTVIDFDQYDTVWTGFNQESFTEPLEALTYACGQHSYSLHIDDTTKAVAEINGVYSNELAKWGLWAVMKNSTEWTEIPAPYDSVKLNDCTVTSWSYRADGEKPTVAVDSIGQCIYGYKQSTRTISLSPSTTEIVSSVGAVKSIVGTDRYSNYPEEVVKRQESGDIAIVGDFTTPSYESIVKQRPTMVLCDGSQYNHVTTAQKLRNNGMNAIVLYPGESISTVTDNIFIAGLALGYDLAGKSKIDDILSSIGEMKHLLDESFETMKVRTMVALDADKSPFVSGSYTYVDDSLISMYGENVFSEYDGWSHINSELILLKNPSAIIIMNSEYKATGSEYSAMLNSMSKEWKSTDAYLSGNIYLMCESAGDLSQRPGPRVAQMTELIARILNPAVFNDIELPKFIGDDYREYLSYTKYIE